MRLLYAMELTVGTALGLAACRASLAVDGNLADFSSNFTGVTLAALRTRDWWYVAVMWLWSPAIVFLSVQALVGGIGLAVEAIHRRGRGMVWGYGRRVWAISSLYAAGCIGGTAVRLRNSWPLAWSQFEQNHIQQFDNVAWVVLAYTVTLWASGWPVASCRDAREWAGRIFAAASFLPIILYLLTEFLDR